MKVFISWSGEESRQVALALREWLPQALQAVKPYMSETDTEAGELWDYVLSTELEATDFGIVCLTPSNLDSRWLNFEAGALSKAVTKARVVPLLFRLKRPDVGLPLSRFQMKLVSRTGIRDTVKTINRHAEPDRTVDESTLLGTFESVWPKLEALLDAVPAGEEPRQRTQRELLEEILQLVRAQSSRIREEPIYPPEWMVSDVRKAVGPAGKAVGSQTGIIAHVPDFEDVSEHDLRIFAEVQKELEARGMALRIFEQGSGDRTVVLNVE